MGINNEEDISTAGYEDDVTAYLADLDGYGDDPTSFDQVLEVLPSGDLVVI